jgi:uncharacterized protein YbjT (DUF2867 family)
MKIFLTGATGFIGRALVKKLRLMGHEIICGVRRQPGVFASASIEYCKVDYVADVDPAVWVSRLKGVDVVINAVGILREHGAQTFDTIHTRTPMALFAAAASAGVRRVVQISALGADTNAASRYYASKKKADDFLATLPLEWVVVQPSFAYGPDGTSARLFRMLATLPCIPMPGDGMYKVQPIHIDDLAQAIATLVSAPQFFRRRIPLVGPIPMRFAEFLLRLRAALLLGTTRLIHIPLWLMRGIAAVAELFPLSLLSRETLSMLLNGNTADAADTRALLNRSPASVEAFVADARTDAASARLIWLLPPLRWSIAFVWIATAIVSLGMYPLQDSYVLLARVGITGWAAPFVLYSAAALDLAFGIGTLWLSKRRRLWQAQIATIIGYSAVIAIALPEYWTHPFAPMLKNIPMLAAIWLLYELERR